MTREEKAKAIDALKLSAPIKVVTQEDFNTYIQTINQIMDWLEQEPCDDAVSREFLLRDLLLKAQGEKDVSIKWLEEYINSLPSVTPQPRKGHWIEQIDHEENCRTLICSNCDRPALHDGDSIWKHKFCPHCGAKMVEPQESNGEE